MRSLQTEAGPPYPVLLSGARELVEKISAIPSISESNE